MKKTSFYLVIILAMALVLAPIYLAAQSSQSADVMLGAALHQEEVGGDYEAAIETYKKLLAKYPDNRPLAAQAQFRIGICYEKLGLKEAENAFQKVVDNYPDQTEIVRAAKEKLSILQKARAIVEKEDKGIKMTEIPINPKNNAGISFISPDGKKLAYVGVMGDIWVSDITSGKETQLFQTPEFDYWLFWSPDSRYIAHLDDSNNLYVVSAQGGNPKMLIKNDKNFAEEYGVFWPSSWSPDSQYINCLIFKRGLVAIPISGGEWRDVFIYSSPEQEKTYARLILSPNEEYLAYTNSGDIYIMPNKGGDSVQITDHPASDKAYSWSYDGRWLIFMSDRNGKSEPWIIGISPDGKRDGEPFQIPFLSTAGSSMFSWTIDSRIGIAYGKSVSNVFVSNRDGGEEIQLTNMECREMGTKWSPDNRYIAYTSDRGGRQDIWIVPVKGGEPKNISASLSDRPDVYSIANLAWHPSGRSVSCVVINADESGLTVNRSMWSVDIQSGAPLKIPFDYEGYIGNMDWSPDGKRIAFDYSRTEAQNFIEDSDRMYLNIYTMSAEGSEPVRISKSDEEELGFSHPRWSPDGKKIASASAGFDGRIWIVDSKGGEPQAITEKSGSVVWGVSWSPDGKNIIFSRREGKKWVCYSVSSQGGELQKLNIEAYNPDVSPDGKKIVYSKIMKGINQYWLLENFLPEKNKN